MSARTSGQQIDDYLERLKAELAFLGATEAQDTVSEIRSLLTDAGGDDPDRTASEIARLGAPADLAAGILAEKGLSPADGMSTAEWWRMGVAVPLDIVMGVAVPLAVAFPAFAIATQARPPAWAPVLGIVAAAIALFWPWYVWRPWRTGGPRVTAGMALTGLTVVRAPGFRRVVRTRDLESLGMRTPSQPGLIGLWLFAAVAVALGLMWTVFYLTGSTPASPTSQVAVFEAVAGPEVEQRRQAADTVSMKYESLVRFGEDYRGETTVLGYALPAYEKLVRRAQEEKLASYEIGEPTKVSPGCWRVVATERTARGTHTVTFLVVLRVTLQPGDAASFAYAPEWVIHGISGEGLTAAP